MPQTENGSDKASILRETCEEVCKNPFKQKILLILGVIVILLGIGSLYLHNCAMSNLPWILIGVKDSEKLFICQKSGSCECKAQKAEESEGEALKHMIPHLFAVSLELFLAVILIELLWRKHEKDQEEEERSTQLRLIKSKMFQAEMLELFKANFKALDAVKMDWCKEEKDNPIKSVWGKVKGLDGSESNENNKGQDLLNSVGQLEDLEYTLSEKEDPSLGKVLYKKSRRISGAKDANEAVVFVEHYMNGEWSIWKHFLDLGIAMNFDRIVNDMIEILGCIAWVRRRAMSEKVSEVQFLESLIIDEKVGGKELTALDEEMRRKIHRIVARGILKYVELVRELCAENKREQLKLLRDACK
jgi:hypothetical protein